MTYAIQNLLSVLRMTAGRRLLALERMAAAAAARPEAAPLAAPFADAIARQHAALKLAAEWRSVQGDVAIHGNDARALDAAVDRAVGALHDALEGIERAFGEEQASLARKVLAAVFPNGAGALVNLAYVDEHAAVGELVTVLGSPATELGGAIAALGLAPWVARIDAVNQPYGKALSRPARLAWDDVRAADDDAYEALGEMVARIVGLYPTNKPVDVAAREAILEPLVLQQRQFSAQRAERRSAKAGRAFDAAPADPDDLDDLDGEDLDDDLARASASSEVSASRPASPAPSGRPSATSSSATSSSATSSSATSSSSTSAPSATTSSARASPVIPAPATPTSATPTSATATLSTQSDSGSPDTA